MPKPFRSLALIGVVLAFAVCTVGAAPPNLDRALEAQRALIAEAPTSAVAYNDLGNLLVIADRYSEAETAYRRAVELDPTSAAARFNLGLLLQQTGQEAEATQAFRDLLDLHPSHAWAHYQLGMIADEAGKRPRALENYARAFALDPTLSFAEINPHVIDNEMATEALLLSSRYLTSATSRVPRQYAEADRIAELMLTPEPGAETAPAVGAPAAEIEGAGHGAGTTRGSSGTSFSTGTAPRYDAEGGTPIEPAGEGGTARDGWDEDERPIRGATVGRVITGDDLDPNDNTGQVEGAGSRPPTRSRYERPATSRQPVARPNPRVDSRDSSGGSSLGGGNVRGGAVQGGTIQGGNVQQGGSTTSRPPRYRPSRRSTASLGLELLDPDEAAIYGR